MTSAGKVIYVVMLWAGMIYAAGNADSLTRTNYNNELSGQYEYALSLYSGEKYFDSITELRRLLFFDTSGVYSYKASKLIGDSYKMGARYTDALIWFTKAEMKAVQKEDIINCRLERIKINILRKFSFTALKDLDSLESIYSNKDEINYWRGWAYAFNNQWDKAASYFSLSSMGNELKLLSDKTNADKYNVSLAKIMSYIVPGSGQAYTGHYVSGLLSLGWNVLWGYNIITAIQADRIFDAVAVANFLWARFYFGNIENAEKFALDENEQIFNKALDYMQFQYKGEKP